MSSEHMSEVKAFGSWALSSILDAAFLVFWVVLQWGVQQIIDLFPLKGLDQYVLTTFQFIFAITTLLPVIFYIIVDGVKIYYQARIKIHTEKERLNGVQL